MDNFRGTTRREVSYPHSTGPQGQTTQRHHLEANIAMEPPPATETELENPWK